MFIPESLTTNPKKLTAETLRKRKGFSHLQRPSRAHGNGMHQKTGSPYKSVPGSRQTLVTFMWLHKRLSSQGGVKCLGTFGVGVQLTREKRGHHGKLGSPRCQKRDSELGASAPLWDRWHFGSSLLPSLFFYYSPIHFPRKY